MAQLDRPTLLANVKVWLPPANTLTDAQLNMLIESVITNVLTIHDDIADNEDLYEKEIICKSVLAAAEMNIAMTSVGSSSQAVKRHKTDDVEIEWWNKADGGRSDWERFIDSLKKDLCPKYIGYTFKRIVGAKVVLSGTKIVPCPTSEDDCDCGL